MITWTGASLDVTSGSFGTSTNNTHADITAGRLTLLLIIEQSVLVCTGYPGTITLTGASLDVTSGPFGTSTNNTRPVTSVAASPSSGSGLSHSKKDAAIAVPVIVGALLAACKHKCILIDCHCVIV